jgi:hypothetical protein
LLAHSVLGLDSRKLMRSYCLLGHWFREVIELDAALDDVTLSGQLGQSSFDCRRAQRNLGENCLTGVFVKMYHRPNRSGCSMHRQTSVCSSAQVFG